MNFQEIIDAANLEVGGCIKMLKEGYEIEVDDGSTMTRASSGRARIRRLYDGSQYSFTVQVGPMPRAAVYFFYTQYDTNKNIVNELTDPLTSIAYSVLWLSPPSVSSVEGKQAVMQFEFTGSKLL